MVKIRKKILTKSISVLTCAGMTAGLFAPAVSGNVAKAASEATREDASVVYFVDAGDYVVDTVCKGDQLGTRNSVTDQVYGEDKVTGYKWGVVDSVSDPLKNGAPSCGGVATDNSWPYEMNTANADAANKKASNRYTKNQYENNVEVRNLDYKFELAAGKYSVEVCTTDPWSCSKSPTLLIGSADPDKDFAAGKGKVLSSDTPEEETVTLDKDGELTVSLRGKGDDNKAINLCYILIKDTAKIPPKDPEEEKGNAVLDINSIYFQSYDVYDDINLPTVGENKSKIEWTSSNEGVLSSDGTVNRPGQGQPDAVVALTASVSDGKDTIKKEFIFTVIAENDMSNIDQFNLDEVEITDDYYLAAEQSDIDFLKNFDNDRILYHFRDTAGIDTNGAKTYNGWEDSLIAGHSVGHYLTAVAQAIKATGDSELKEKLDEIIHGLKECQDAVGTGYIFGAKVEDRSNIEKQFDIVEGKASGGTWVPWYTMHKIIAGLVDTYKFTGNKEALEVASNLGTWVYNRVSKWSKQTNKSILYTEYGGMNDCLYELYYYTRNEEHKLAAEKFDDPDLYEVITSGNKNTLAKRHANATIPKFVGAIKRYEVLSETGEATEEDKAYFEYAKKFFELVVADHSYITGGVSDMEHFRDDNAQDSTRTQCNNESCCAYNLLKLARELFKITGERKYADYYDTTLRNAIMGAINTENGATSYFSPMATGYFKTFGNEDPDKNMFWCCTGSGMENFTKLGDSIYFKKGNELFVNQYIASKVTWKEAGMNIEQISNVTTSDEAKFNITLTDGSASKEAAINLRVPDWIAGTPVVKVNNTVVNDAIVSSGYIRVSRAWNSGDVISFTYPMEVKAYGLADNSTVYGFKYGPTVLAAKLGKESMSKTTWAGANLTAPLIKVVGDEQASLTIGYNTTNRQILGTETLTITEDMSISEFMDSAATYFVKDTSAQVPTFKLTGTDADDNISGGLTFVPYNTLNDERYGIYWYFESSVEEMTPEKILATKDEARQAKSRIDSIQPGYSQYEKDAIHQLVEENTVASTIEGGGSTRYAKAGGSFTYNMIVDKNKANRIVCQFAKEDDGKTIKISVGNTVIAEYTLKSEDSAEFYKVSFDIPNDVMTANVKDLSATDASGNAKTETVVPVKFESANSSDSARLVGGLYMAVQYSNNASITAVTCDAGTVVPSSDKKTYDIYVPKTSSTVKYKVTIADQYGLLYINDVLVNDAKNQKLILTGDKTTINAKVFGEDHKTSADYVINFIKGDAPITVKPGTSTPTTGANTGAVTGTQPQTTTNALADAVNAFKQTTVAAKTIGYKGNNVKIRLKYTDAFDKALAAGTVSVKQITYTSSNKKVVKVKRNKLKALKKGTAKVTVNVTLSTGDVLKLATTVKVKNPKIKITGKKTVVKGKSVKLKAKAYGIKGKIKWSVSNKSIAKVKNGKVKGLAKGTVKVTAKIKKVKKTVSVKVK